MVILVARQIGIYVISTTVGVVVGAYGPKFINKNAITIIGNLMSGGL